MEKNSGVKPQVKTRGIDERYFEREVGKKTAKGRLDFSHITKEKIDL